jgi:hypothetical protein
MRKLVVLMTVVVILGALAALPASAADYSCPGSLAPRLGLGSRGQIAQTFSTLRNAPGGSPVQIVYAPASFTVVEGPSCDGYLTYFRVQYDNGGPNGWAAESQIYSPWGYNQYWLEPTNAPPPPPPPPTNICPGSLPTRLQIGQHGDITEVFSTLRNAPGGTPIRILYPPATFTVLAGPASDGYLCYFQIQYDNGGPTGWAAESQIYSVWGNNRYWLAPQ